MYRCFIHCGFDEVWLHLLTVIDNSPISGAAPSLGISLVSWWSLKLETLLALLLKPSWVLWFTTGTSLIIVVAFIFTPYAGFWLDSTLQNLQQRLIFLLLIYHIYILFLLFYINVFMRTLVPSFWLWVFMHFMSWVLYVHFNIQNPGTFLVLYWKDLWFL